MRPRLLLQVAGVEARKRMTYRVDFWINAIVGFLAQLGVAWFIVAAVFAGSGRAQVGGYGRDGMLLYFILVLLFGRVVRGPEMDMAVSSDIYEGGLTRYLLYPTSYLGMKYAQHLGSLLPALLQIFLFGAWVPFAIGMPEGVRITPASAAMCVVSLAVANVLHFLICWTLQLVSFWADNVWSLIVAHRFVSGLLGGFILPLSLFPAWSQPVLSALPFRTYFDFPVNVLFGRVAPAEWAIGMLVAVGWCAVMSLAGRLVFRRGDLQYTGVGI